MPSELRLAQGDEVVAVTSNGDELAGYVAGFCIETTTRGRLTFDASKVRAVHRDDAWLDRDASPLHVVAAAYDGTDRVCRYCPEHGTPEAQGVITTGIRSPRWGEWETCHRCAVVHLAALHGIPIEAFGDDDRVRIERAQRECRRLAALLEV